jgi:hypothetical protein
MKKKILIVENVSEIETVLGAYIHQAFPDREVKILTNIDRVPKEQVVEALKWCDTFVVQSFFDGSKQFIQFVMLFVALKVTPEVHLIHSKNELLRFINTIVDKHTFEDLKQMVLDGLKVFDVHHRTYDDPTGSSAFFKKHIHKFDAIPIYYNEKYDVLFDERETSSILLPYSGNMFKYKTFYLPDAPNSILDKLTKDELRELKNMLSEMYVQLDEKLEDLDTVAAKFFDAKEKTSLKKEHTKRRKILEKIGIAPFK